MGVSRLTPTGLLGQTSRTITGSLKEGYVEQRLCMVRDLGYGARVTEERGYGGLCPHPPKGHWPSGLPSRCGGGDFWPPPVAGKGQNEPNEQRSVTPKAAGDYCELRSFVGAERRDVLCLRR